MSLISTSLFHNFCKLFVHLPRILSSARIAVRHSLLFSCANILPRQFLACFLAGLTVALVTGAGAAVRLVMEANPLGLIAWLAGALFLPSLALFLGIFSSTSKPFEGLLTALWYIGPMNHVPGLDFTGAANGPRPISLAFLYIALAAAFLISAYVIRSHQLQHN